MSSFQRPVTPGAHVSEPNFIYPTLVQRTSSIYRGLILHDGSGLERWPEFGILLPTVYGFLKNCGKSDLSSSKWRIWYLQGF
jgi:hypothetical protein